MKLFNKFTIIKIIFILLLITLLIFPFESAGISMLTIFVSELLVVDVKYLIAGAIFIFICLIDLIEELIKKKKQSVTDNSKMLDSIINKLLINSTLIILSSQGFIHPVIPVIIISRDSIVSLIKTMLYSKDNLVISKLGKAKTICLKLGLALTLFYNLPFELWNLRIADMLLIIATAMSIISGVNYFEIYKNSIEK
ncbi:MAG: hypothetical protein IJZ36_04385 [Bacilli bacterium]|nr:hypothetical protein [Bacilli bacterium]